MPLYRYICAVLCLLGYCLKPLLCPGLKISLPQGYLDRFKSYLSSKVRSLSFILRVCAHSQCHSSLALTPTLPPQVAVAHGSAQYVSLQLRAVLHNGLRALGGLGPFNCDSGEREGMPATLRSGTAVAICLCTYIFRAECVF